MMTGRPPTKVFVVQWCAQPLYDKKWVTDKGCFTDSRDAEVRAADILANDLRKRKYGDAAIVRVIELEFNTTYASSEWNHEHSPVVAPYDVDYYS